MSKPKIVILGAGYAGLKTVKELQIKHLDAEIILVNKNPYHYEATQLHEVAAGTEPPEKISFEITHVLKKDKVQFIQDTVEKVDLEQKQVILKDGAPLSYDYVVIALGFISETFGIPGVEEYAKSLVNIPTAIAAKEHLDATLARYQESKDPLDLSVIVCGAGFTGIEYLGEITNRIPKLAKEYNFPADQVKITCVEAATKLLPMFSDKLSTYGIETLKKRGVHFLTGAAIKAIEPGAVVYEKDNEEQRVYGNTIIWTTGVKGSPVIENSGIDQHRGRVMVEENLTLKDHPEVYIIGDVSAVMDPESNRPFPTTAQIALKQGEYVAKHIHAILEKKPIEAFTFKPLGTVASLGNNDGFGTVLGKDVKGYIGSIMKKNIVNKSLLEVGDLGVLLKKGRFDYYH